MGAIKLNPAHAELISLIYHNNKNALEASQALIDDPTFFVNLKNEVIRPLITKFKWIKDGLDIKVPRCNQAIHNTQLKHADTQRLNEINRLYCRMTPEQQEFLETISIGMVKGEVINVSCSEDAENIF